MNYLLKMVDRQLNLLVSNTGEVFRGEKKLTPEITNIGYCRIKFMINGKLYRFLVHRLVAEAFISNPNNYPIVNHKDGNKLNNSVENLEWCTYGENLSHAYNTGLRDCHGIKNPRSKLTADDVVEIRRTYVKGKHSEYNSYSLAKKYGVSSNTILKVVKNISYI